jgi:transcriptional regulator with XRE-family HTH domain
MKRFDARALYQAIDEKRKARGLSWREVAAEIGVGVSTITRTKGGGRMEVDGMLAMVAWLGTSVENFVHESSNQSPNIS